MDDQEILQELAEVMDRLNVLPDDAFAERWSLKERQDELRASLYELLGDEAREIDADWSGQASQKRDEKRPRPPPRWVGDSNIS